ncbi:ATP-binding protein [Flavobacterium arcticum]|uniref:ATP-binding protein n=1 Tax=Flavobacterium arcticum TaxID=1784713 RepID=A0A345HCR1_9FLAO|nr:ATP-binding protein [Flavobacterium arcticum]AXG74371.1 ATP-binding protein [Flavobacterium arcticum]KAF2507514.1 ATP-binding protein [Flavobacterium arcticum]
MYNKLYIQVLEQEIDWLQSIIDQTIKQYLMQEGYEEQQELISPPNLSGIECPYAQIVSQMELGIVERLALALTLAPQIKPEALDIFFGKNQIYDRGFTEFGGVTDKEHSGFLPTGQTLYFIAASTRPELKSNVLEVLESNSPLFKEQILHIKDTDSYLPKLNGILYLDKSWLHYFMTDSKPQREHSPDFPAEQINTEIDWDDVVLDAPVMQQVTEIINWLEHGNTLMYEWNLKRKIKPGYRALFYGTPGTGKTLTATMIGKVTGKEVYRVDLSMIVSKYIGETEKNLSKLFDAAQHSDWILFFDEADSLFGKRTAANSSNDRHANQQTAYLLQRIEDFPGVVILASNLKANMDEAFLRRFQSIIHFTMPSPEERLLLWQKAFSDTCTLHPDIDIEEIAEQYEVAGGAIINVLRFCALAAITRKDTVVNNSELIEGIRREFKKENKTLHLHHTGV